MINHENGLVKLETSNSKTLFDNLTKLGFDFNKVDFDITDVAVFFGDGELLIDKNEFQPPNPAHTIEQILKLTFYSAEKIINYPIKLSGESRDMTKIFAEFSPFNYEFGQLSYEEIHDRIVTIVKKKMVRFGLFISNDCNSVDSFREFEPIISNIQQNNGELSEKIKILVSQTFPKVEPERFLLDIKAIVGKDAVAEKNKTKKEASELAQDEDRILYSVKKGELILISKIGRIGINGRDHYGKVLCVPEVNVEDLKPLKFKYDKKYIEEKDASNEECHYYALQSGYIYIDHYKDYSEIVFNDTFHAKTINRHQTGDIHLPSTTIKVSDFNNPKDLIYEATITSDKLDVNGSIGENSTVNASEILVNGTTHVSSTIKAEKINIKIHKGTMEGDTINIKEVETGSMIVGNIINIDRALGGTIIGNEIYIKECKNNNKITAKRLVQIDTITGEHNKISIEDGITADDKIELDEIKIELKNLNFKLQNDNVSLKKTLEIIESQKPQKKALEDKIKEFPDKSKIPVGIINNYKQIMSRIKNYNTQFVAYQETRAEREKMLGRIAELEAEILSSFINISSTTTSNKYTFKTLTGKTLEFKDHSAKKLWLKLDKELEMVENNT